jgi:diacylglycerol kinase (ATP)
MNFDISLHAHGVVAQAIVPLGTGNDLARSLGWGKRLRVVGDVLEYLRLVIQASPVTLDQWRVILQPHARLPNEHKLLNPGSHPQKVDDQELSAQLRSDIQQALGLAPPAAEDVFVGFWQNYCSVGLDAKIAYGVDQSRSYGSCCTRCIFRRGCGKLCYVLEGVRRACCNNLLARSIETIRCMSAREVLRDEDFTDLQPSLQEMPVDCSRGRARQLMMVNINSYGGGLDILPPPREALHPPAPHDGVLEVLAVRNAVFSIAHFLQCRRPCYVTSAKALAFRLAPGEYMQIDGEPWHLDEGCDVLVEPHRTLTMLRAPEGVPCMSHDPVCLHKVSE